MELMSMRRIHLTGSDTWNPSRYDQPPVILSISIIPSPRVHGLTILIPNDDDTSDDTSETESCDSVDDSVDTEAIGDDPKTIGQVSFKFNEVIRELEELSAYKELVRHKVKAMLEQLYGR